MKHRLSNLMFIGMVMTFVAVSAPFSSHAQKATRGDKGGKMAKDTASCLDIPFKTITGEETSLQAFKGNVVLLVNVASECGFTPQYKGLEALYRKYKDSGFVIIGFPANNFGGQEPGSNEEILKFCQTKFDVTFPMMSKISVKGKDKHPLFVYLTEDSNLPGEIGWNFSKFLLDRDGHLVARYPSETTPEDKELVDKIKSLL